MNIGLSSPDKAFQRLAFLEKIMRTVAVIDTHVASRHMLRFALEMQSYKVIEVDDVAGAFAVLSIRNPDLLVIGIDPSVAECRDLVGMLRSNPEMNGLPILLVGEDLFKEAWDLRGIGNCSWLNRPFRVGELHSSVESLLGNALAPGYLNR